MFARSILTVGLALLAAVEALPQKRGKGTAQEQAAKIPQVSLTDHCSTIGMLTDSRESQRVRMAL
jgi:hypothetical protein